jgi:urease accessory protein
MIAKRIAGWGMFAAVCFSHSAFAHPGHPLNGVAGGAAHPFSGMDHILAMLAVGIWAAQLGGRALWLVPCAFVALMAGGGALGMSVGHPLPGIESGIAASVLVLGLLVAMAVRAPLYISVPLVGFFALFHGFAHGTEMTAGASTMSYAAGFMFATAALHAVGIALGVLTRRLLSAPLLFRATGAALTLAGVLLMAGAIRA